MRRDSLLWLTTMSSSIQTDFYRRIFQCSCGKNLGSTNNNSLPFSQLWFGYFLLKHCAAIASLFESGENSIGFGDIFINLYVNDNSDKMPWKSWSLQDKLEPLPSNQWTNKWIYEFTTEMILRNDCTTNEIPRYVFAIFESVITNPFQRSKLIFEHKHIVFLFGIIAKHRISLSIEERSANAQEDTI